MTCATTYTKPNGETGSAVVYQGTAPRRRRTTLRDRIARLHLDAINPDLAAAFDSPLWVGIDPSSSDDLTAVWVLHQGSDAP